MGNQLLNSVVTVAVAIIGVAIVAVLVSRNANTSQVISSASQGFSGALSTALSPVSGSSSLNFGGFPGGGGSSLSQF
jgi:PRD1 phage membrane DNA delivery